MRKSNSRGSMHLSVADGPNQDDWVAFQTTTFTNWARENIKKAHSIESVDDLTTAFEDGVSLIKLVEVVSGKKVNKYCRKPRIFSQKLDNIKLALDMLTDDGIKLVNIGPEDVHSGNQKLILGLIWRMILHYQISTSSNVSGKLLLITWLQAAIPDVQIKNLTSDWNDGRAMAGLMEFLEPGSYPNYKDLRPEDNLEIVTECMEMAETNHGIPQVVSPSYIVSPAKDELSMMTYLSYYTQLGSPGEKATLKFVNDYSPRIRVSNFNTDWSNGVNLVRFTDSVCPGLIPNHEQVLASQSPVENVEMCFEAVEKNFNIKPTMQAKDFVGGNIDELSVMAYLLQFRGLKMEDKSGEFKVDASTLRNGVVGEEVEFDVIANNNMTFENLQVSVESPSGHRIPVKFEETGNELHCAYVPMESGTHVVSVSHLDSEIPSSPFHTKVREDVNGVTVSGPSIKYAVYNDKFDLLISSSRSHVTPLAVVVDGPTSTIPSEIFETNGNYEVSFIPVEVGEHNVDIRFGDTPIPGSPLKVMVGDPKRVVITDRESVETGLLNKAVEFNVNTEAAGGGVLTATGRGPKGEVNVDVRELGNSLYRISFVPVEPGEYIIKLFFNGKEIGGSPLGTIVADPGKAVAHGEGLYQVRLHEQEEFLVSLHGAGKGQLAITAVSPFGESVPVQIEQSQSESDTYVVHYTPQEIGDHKIFVKFAGVNVRGSPFVVKVADPSKVLVQNLSEDEMTVGNEVIIPLEVLEEAGEGELEAEILAPGNVTVESSFVQRTENLYHLRFVPTVPGEYTIKILFGGGLIAGQPMKVDVTEPHIPPDASKCIVYGGGLKECDVNKLGEFTVDCSDAGEGIITSTLQGVQYTSTDVEVQDNGNGTYDCRYVASIPGTYALHVLFDGDNVPGSPFTVEIIGEPELPQCTVEGKALTTGGFVDEPIKLTVITGSSDTGVLAVRCEGPSKDCDANANDNRNGTYTLEIYPTESGLHSIHIEWGGQPVQGSPFEVNVVDRPIAANIVAVGPGVENGVIDDFEGKFVIDTKGAGAGTLKIKIHGPKDCFDLKCIKKQLKDRNVAVKYSPSQAGRYDISVTWLGEDISGSPYTVFVAENDNDLQKINGTGDTY